MSDNLEVEDERWNKGVTCSKMEAYIRWGNNKRSRIWGHGEGAAISIQGTAFAANAKCAHTTTNIRRLRPRIKEKRKADGQFATPPSALKRPIFYPHKFITARFASSATIFSFLSSFSARITSKPVYHYRMHFYESQPIAIQFTRFIPRPAPAQPALTNDNYPPSYSSLCLVPEKLTNRRKSFLALIDIMFRYTLLERWEITPIWCNNWKSYICHTSFRMHSLFLYDFSNNLCYSSLLLYPHLALSIKTSCCFRLF